MSGVAPSVTTDAALPSPLDTARPSFFGDPGIDQVFTMTLELAAEVWTLRERLFAVEAVADERGLDLSRAVEAWRPSPDQQATLDALRERMMAHLFRTAAPSE